MKKERTVLENMAGGIGHVIIDRILGEKEMHGNCGLYAQVTLEPQCEIGYHEHHGESETYYILKGTGIYNDNGQKRTVTEGDITFTPDGSAHGLLNESQETMVLMALIIMD